MKTRRHALILAALAAAGMAETAAAAPPDLAAHCAALLTPQAQRAATINNQLYTFQWFRMELTRTTVTLDLVINGPTGAVRYAGFKCQSGANGLQIIADPLG